MVESANCAEGKAPCVEAMRCSSGTALEEAPLAPSPPAPEPGVELLAPLAIAASPFSLYGALAVLKLSGLPTFEVLLAAGGMVEVEGKPDDPAAAAAAAAA